MATMHPVGHVLPGGAVVTGYTSTAYKATLNGGTVFVPYVKVHPLVPATPLVTLA